MFRSLLKRLFTPSVTITRTSSRPLSADQWAAFDRASRKMDEAFVELNKVFKP